MGYDYSQIACVGMDDPASGIGKEKWEFAKACLREVCFFSAAFARRLHPSLLLSVELMLFRQETINAEVSVLISVFHGSISVVPSFQELNCSGQKPWTRPLSFLRPAGV